MPFQRARNRLALWNLGVFSLVLVTTMGAAVVSIVREHDVSIDHELRAGAAREATRVLRARHEASEKHERHRERRERDERDENEEHEHGVALDEARDLLVSFERDGSLTPRAPLRRVLDEGAFAAALRGEETHAESEIAGVRLRILTTAVRQNGQVVGAVQIAKPLGAERRDLSVTILTLLLTGGAGLLVAAGASFFLAGRAMRPVGEAFDRQRRFIADASHELRTPVAVLRGRAELLRRDFVSLPQDARTELDLLDQDAEQLTQLLGELLDLARIDAGEGAPTLEPVALRDAADDLVAQLSQLARSRGVELSVRGSAEWAQTSLSRLRQVLRALVDNALRHTPSGGHVVLDIGREGQRVSIRVVDDGEGIAAEHLPRIFDRFYRVDEARGTGGAGLGLAIAAEIVRQMRGEIRVESEWGRGTTMIVLLPRPHGHVAPTSSGK
jgi:signal transduction histidine kinase